VSCSAQSVAVAEEVRSLMARRRISQIEVARHLRIGQSSVSRRLQAQYPFTVDELYRLCDLLEVSPSELLPDKASA